MNIIQFVFSILEIRKLILHYRHEKQKKDYIKRIYPEWIYDEITNEHRIFTIPNGVTHIPGTISTKWSIMRRENNSRNTSINEILIITDIVQNTYGQEYYYEWIVDTIHLHLKYKWWYIPEHLRGDANKHGYNDNDLRNYYIHDMDFKTKYRYYQNIKLQKEKKYRYNVYKRIHGYE